MIRPYTDADRDELLEVWHAASLVAHHFLPDDFFPAERRAIAEQWLPASDTVVYEQDGRVVGLLSMVGDEVGAIFVDPAFQGRGIGRALMDHATAGRLAVELEVFAANEIGRRFYDRYGFVEIGRSVHEPTEQLSIRMRFES